MKFVHSIVSPCKYILHAGIGIWINSRTSYLLMDSKAQSDLDVQPVLLSGHIRSYYPARLVIGSKFPETRLGVNPLKVRNVVMNEIFMPAWGLFKN